MRHRNKGRKLGRNPNHQRALLRNLASALILTERDAQLDDNEPRVKGRIITTLPKAKEVRPLVEKCITIARRALPMLEKADRMEPHADRFSDDWRRWRESEQWYEWNRTMAPVVAARRRVLRLLGNKKAVRLLFEEIAPRYRDRDGGYTRILKLATPRLGDAGARAILEFVSAEGRAKKRKPVKPSFDVEVAPGAAPQAASPSPSAAAEQAAVQAPASSEVPSADNGVQQGGESAEKQS